MPSTVGTSTSAEATPFVGQRICFYANGRFFVFYSDGTNIVYRSSIDGINWSGATTVRAGTVARSFQVWWDGTYVQYSFGSDVSNGPVYYRRGTISDGTITWETERTAVAGVVNRWFSHTVVTKDSGGYPWVGWCDSGAGIAYFKVKRATAQDGSTWGSESILYTIGAWEGVQGKLVPLTNNRLYATYAKIDDSKLRGKLYDGSSWGSEETSTSGVRERYHDVVSQNDDVFEVWLKATTYDILFRKRTYGVGWGAEVTVYSAAQLGSRPSLSIDLATGNLYCFWCGDPTADHVYYKRYSGGSWDVNETDWITETTDHLTSNDRGSSFFRDYTSIIGYTYMTKTGSPYDVRFAFLTLISSGSKAFSFSTTIRKAASKNLSFSCEIPTPASKNLSISSVIKNLGSKTLSFSSIIRNISAKTLSFSLLVAQFKNLGFSSIIRKAATEVLSISTVLRKTTSKNLPFSTSVTNEGSRNLSISFVLRNAGQKDFSFSILLRFSAGKAFSFSTLIRNASSRDFQFSSWIRTQTAQVDSEKEDSGKYEETVMW